MLKFTAYSFALLTLMFCVVLALLMNVGRAVETHLLTLLTSLTLDVQVSPSRFHLIDIDRGLLISFGIPLENVRDVGLLHYDKPAALLLVQENGQESSRAELYHFDLISRKVKPLFAPGQQDAASFRNIFDSNAWWSRDGRRVAFYDPDNPGIYIADLETLETTLIAELDPGSLRFPNYILWSPDNQQLILQRDASLLVVNIDGSNLREFSALQMFNPAVYVPPAWSPDSKYIMLSSDALMYPIQVMDAQTGADHPMTTHLEGVRPVWSCDNTQLAYIRRSGSHPNIVTDVYLLNLVDGKETNLSIHPVLAGQEVTRVTWSTDCQWLVITGGPWQPHLSPSRRLPLGSIYIIDPLYQDIRLVTEAGWVVSSGDEGIIYVAPDETDPEQHVIYGLTLGMDTEPIHITEFKGSYHIRNSFYDWSHILLMDWQPFPPGTQLGVLDARTGSLRYLTDGREYISNYTYRR